MNFDDKGPSGNELWTQMVVDTTNVNTQTTQQNHTVKFYLRLISQILKETVLWRSKERLIEIYYNKRQYKYIFCAFQTLLCRFIN